MNISHFPEKVTALFSEKAHGSMRLHDNAAFDEQARSFRHAFLWANQIDPKSVVSARLVHGNRVEVVSDPKQADVFIDNVDALVTGDKNVYLSITGADCFPLYLYDPVKEVIALAHCGWKGVLAGVIEATIARMKSDFNCDPADILAYVGPGLLPCHYEVRAHVALKFPGFAVKGMKYMPIEGANADDQNADTWHNVPQWYLNLESAIVYRLAESGLTPLGISVAHTCTFCNKAIPMLNVPPEKSEVTYRWFSFRREKSDPLRTQMAVFGMR